MQVRRALLVVTLLLAGLALAASGAVIVNGLRSDCKQPSATREGATRFAVVRGSSRARW